MKQVNIILHYDDEKLSALRMYMEQKDTDLNEELLKGLDALYAKYVPANVREYIEIKEKMKPAPLPKKPKTVPSESEVSVENTELGH